MVGSPGYLAHAALRQEIHQVMNIHIAMPSGCSSRGYDPEAFIHKGETPADCVERVLGSIVSQLSAWKGFTADVVVLNNTSVEVQRRHVEG